MTDLKNSRLTKYDDSYGTCYESHVKLLIYTGETDPDFVTQRLGVTPTSISKKGDIIRTKLGRTRVTNNNIWLLSSEEKVDSKDLRRHLDWLMKKLVPAEKALKSIQNLAGITMTIKCVWWSAHGHGGPALWPEQMKAMAALNLECGFDIYFVSETLE